MVLFLLLVYWFGARSFLDRLKSSSTREVEEDPYITVSGEHDACEPETCYLDAYLRMLGRKESR